MKVHVFTGEELKQYRMQHDWHDIPDPIELGDEITIAGVVYVKKEVEENERVVGYYRVRFDGKLEVGFWNGGYWHLTGLRAEHGDEDFEEIDEEIITFKS